MPKKHGRAMESHDAGSKCNIRKLPSLSAVNRIILNEL